MREKGEAGGCQRLMLVELHIQRNRRPDRSENRKVNQKDGGEILCTYIYGYGTADSCRDLQMMMMRLTGSREEQDVKDEKSVQWLIVDGRDSETN